MINDGIYGLTGIDAYLLRGRVYDDNFYLLPEDIQAEVNARANENYFHTEEELRAYVKELSLRA